MNIKIFDIEENDRIQDILDREGYTWVVEED